MKRLNADYGLMSSTNSFPLLPEAHLKVFSHMATLLHSIRLYCMSLLHLGTETQVIVYIHYKSADSIYYMLENLLCLSYIKNGSNS